MGYLGGKERIHKKICAYINLLDCQNYIEPFCGMGSILFRIQKEKIIASDLHKGLIAMWQAVQKGWKPPLRISEDQYNFLKRMDRKGCQSPFVAFAGFSCGFSGNYFKGFARDSRNENYCHVARRSILRKKEALSRIDFISGSYEIHSLAEGNIIYCDPPYKGTSGYSVGKFDHEKFYNWCRMMSKKNIILVSEYQMPDDFKLVLSQETYCSVTRKDRQTKIYDNLYRLG